MAVADSLGEISRSIRPAQVAGTLEAIAANWPAEAAPLNEVVASFPLGADALFHLFSVSSICAARISQHPEILLWLSQPEICADRRGFGRMMTDLDNLAGRGSIAEANFRVLRSWKGREMVRIALDSFSSRDVERARGLVELDELIDRTNRRVSDQVLSMANTPGTQEWGMRMIVVSRCIERIGDNAVDIGEQTAFLVTGEFHEFTDASH